MDMIKRFLAGAVALVVALAVLFSSAPPVLASSGFSDVKENHWSWEAVSALTKQGILSGYEDGTFRPDKTLTTGEFLALTVRLSSQDTGVSDTVHWASDYYDKAESLGLVKKSEIEDTYSDLEDPITRYEMALILSRQAELVMGEPPVVTTGISRHITDYELIPDKYQKAVEQAYARGILSGFEDGAFRGEQNLTRAEAAAALYRLIDKDERLINPENLEGIFSGGLRIQGQDLFLGMTVEELIAVAGEPEDIRKGRYDLSLYFFGTETYEDFFIAEVTFNGYVTSLYTVGRSYSVIGEEGAKITYYRDDFGEKTVYGAAVTVNANLEAYGLTEVKTKNYKAKEEDFSMVSFHYLNAYRVYHGKKPLEISFAAVNAAQYKAADMSGRDYFEHTSPEGVTHRDLLERFGLDVEDDYTGENICAGYQTGFYAANAWIHSEGHRAVLLNDHFTHAGVGMSYNPDSYYEVYFAMIFYGE